METRGKEDKETCRHGDMETYVETWRHGDIDTETRRQETWRHGDKEISRRGGMEIQRLGNIKKYVDVEKLMETWRYQTESEAGDFSLSVYHLHIVET